MKEKKPMLKESIYRKWPLFICAVIVSQLMSGAYLSAIKINLNFMVVFIFVILGILLSEIMTHNKITLGISAAFIVLHIFFSLVYIMVFSDIANFINSAGEALYLKIFWSNRGQTEGNLAVAILLIFIISFSVYVLYVKFKNAIISFLGFFLYVLCHQVFFISKGTDIFIEASVVLAAVLVLFIYNRYDAAKGQKNVKPLAGKFWAKYTTPVLCIILAFSFLLTSFVNIETNQDFIDWLDWVLARNPSFSGFGHSFSQIEFYNPSTDKIRGGPAIINNNFVCNLKVEASDKTSALKTGSIYLRGSAYDYFEDSTWKTKINDGYRNDLMSYIYANNYFAFEGQEKNIKNYINDPDYYQDQTYYIQNQRVAGTMLFSELMLYNISSESGSAILYDNSTYMYQENGPIRDYSGTYKKLLRNESEPFNNLMETKPGNSYNSVKYMIPNELRNNLDSFYLQIPDVIKNQDRISQLADEIVNGAANDYEKAYMIEKYLSDSGNYTYDIKPDNIPNGKDIVSYFLFENKRGYCVYYATSMVMLCRSLGIPSRYVKGYRVDNVENGKNVGVYSKNAHAWVEVYIPDFGWITFDPVSSIEDNLPTGNTTSTRNPTDTSTARASLNPSTGTPAATEPQATQPVYTPPDNTAPAGTQPETLNPGNGFTTAIIIISSVAGLIALLAAAYLVRKHIEINRDIKRSPSKLFNDFVSIKSSQGYIWNEGETVAGYFSKLEDNEYDNLADLFEKCFYSGEILSPEEYEIIKGWLKIEKKRRKKNKSGYKSSPS